MKTIPVIIVLLLSFAFGIPCSFGQEDSKTVIEKEVKENQTKEVSVEKNDVVDNKSEKTQRKSGKNELKDKAQLKNKRAKLAAARAKLEEERLGGELPGDYIAAREEKLAKTEKRLNDLEKSLSQGKQKGEGQSEGASVKE